MHKGKSRFPDRKKDDSASPCHYNTAESYKQSQEANCGILMTKAKHLSFAGRETI